MNEAEFCTDAEAKEAVAVLNEERVGGGVEKLYVPDYAGPFGTPGTAQMKFYHVDFKNGARGHNVGLLRRWLGWGWCPRWMGLQYVKLDVNRNAREE